MTDRSNGEAAEAARGDGESAANGATGADSRPTDEFGDANLMNVGLSHSVAAGMLSVQAAHAMGLGMLVAQELQQNDGILSNAIVATTCAKLLGIDLFALDGARDKPGDPLAEVLKKARSRIEMSLGRLETATGSGGAAAMARELLDSIEAQTNHVRSALDAAAIAGRGAAEKPTGQPHSGKARGGGTARKTAEGRKHSNEAVANRTATQEAP